MGKSPVGQRKECSCGESDGCEAAQEASDVWARVPVRSYANSSDLPSPSQRLLSEPCADPFDEQHSGWMIARHQITTARRADNERGSALAWWIGSKFYRSYSDENNKQVLTRYVFGEPRHNQTFLVALDILAGVALLTGAILTLVANCIARPVRPRNIVAVSLFIPGLLFTQIVQLFFHCLALGGRGRPRCFAALQRMDMITHVVALYLCALWPATLVLVWNRFTFVVACAGFAPFLGAVLFASIMGPRCPIWLVRSLEACLWLCGTIIFLITRHAIRARELAFALAVPCHLFHSGVLLMVAAEATELLRRPRRFFHELTHVAGVLALCCFYSTLETAPRGLAGVRI